ncbi:hypothetical protein IFM89_014887 [Coptis chinensis]|uniref:Uncharacterized protein n=1 Tax=Coptis chinensis TaxID=261450 RepID=A0A835LLL4_9MAGN|nr:hypothetical protein IFM89_014887 [Coptis chinensis]
MRRCSGLVLGIVGRSASAKSLAIRSLAFKMSVFYFDVPEVKSVIYRCAFLVNTGSSQLLDDYALKQLLIDGTIAGCVGWC